MPDLFFNRELSWLAFNERVLKEATDSTVPLLERLKYVGIFSSNLDEFFMIRVAGLKDQIKTGYDKPDFSGLTPREQLGKIRKKTTLLLKEQQKIFEDIQFKLRSHGIFFKAQNLDDFPISALFYNDILPAISPVTISPSNPFPFIHNLNLNLFSLIANSNIYSSIIIVPNSLKRYYIFTKDSNIFIFHLEDIIKQYLPFIYKGWEIRESFLFRLTRNADLSFQNEEVEDLYSEIKNSLTKRVLGSPVRLEVCGSLSDEPKNILLDAFDLTEEDIYVINDMMDYRFLTEVNIEKEGLKYKPIKQRIPPILKKDDIFKAIREQDILMIRPYNDFGVIGRLVEQAAEDRDVISIKMTLYRANRDSSIIKSLEKAALAGKHVCVVIELKARFDEEKNLEWAEKLEKAGCIVSYGFVDLKIHAKALIIIRKEGGKIVRYTHLSTGNYNETTAKLYTDVDFLTSDESMGNDVVKLFNYIMSYSDQVEWEKLKVAPLYLRKELIRLIDNEINIAKSGKQSHIIAKINSLYDKEITLKLYEASKAGVKIDLIVRGITSVVPGVKDISENISLKSIIGRFLEHPRVICFHSGGEKRIYLSTADLMVRNLDKRVEVMFEIEDKNLKEMLYNYLMLNLNDNQKSWVLTRTGRYVKKKSSTKKINLQTDMEKLLL